MIDSKYRHYLRDDISYIMSNRANNHFERWCVWQCIYVSKLGDGSRMIKTALSKLEITSVNSKYGWCQSPSNTLHDIFYVDHQSCKSCKITSLPKLCSHYAIFWTIYAYGHQINTQRFLNMFLILATCLLMALAQSTMSVLYDFKHRLEIWQLVYSYKSTWKSQNVDKNVFQ